MIREIIGSKIIEIEVESEDIESLVRELVSRYPKLETHLLDNNLLNSNMVYAVDGKRLDSNQLSERLLSPDQEIAIIPPAGGG